MEKSKKDNKPESVYPKAEKTVFLLIRKDDCLRIKLACRQIIASCKEIEACLPSPDSEHIMRAAY